MNRKIIAGIIKAANELDVLGFETEANELTKLAQAYGRREVGPPTIIEVGPRGSFGTSAKDDYKGVDLATSKSYNEAIVVLFFEANQTEKRLDGFNNIVHANNTAKKIARDTKEKYGFEPEVKLWAADPAKNKAYEMFMAGEIERFDFATIRDLRNDMYAAQNARPSDVRPAPPAPRKGGVYTLTYNYVDGKGWTVIMNEDGRIRELTPSSGKFKDSNHAENYCKSIQRKRPEFKIIFGMAEDANKKALEEMRKKRERAEGYYGDIDPRDRHS